MDIVAEFLSATVNPFESNKRLADRAVEQVPDDKIHVALDANTNSIPVIRKYVAGNLVSRRMVEDSFRFTDVVMNPKRLLLGLLFFWLGMPATAPAPAAAPPVVSKLLVGSTRVARWQDDRKAAFLLMFDDSVPSHWQVAAPELVKRGLVATFYLNPGKAEFQRFKDRRETELWKQGMVYGNHTMTHRGVKDFKDADWEIGECASLIRAMAPGHPRLLSYAQPGVPKGAWNITDEQLNRLLDKYHLVSRPDARGHMAVYHLKSAAEMLALADRAIEKGGMEYLIIHGVERIKPDWGYQDFWALKQAVLLPVLDGLKQRRDRGELWVTDHVSQHRYEKERQGASLRTLEATDERVRLDLTSTADPRFYDLPLTLVTRVPDSWRQATVKQGGRSVSVKVRAGEVRFQAVPNGGPITLTAPYERRRAETQGADPPAPDEGRQCARDDHDRHGGPGGH